MKHIVEGRHYATTLGSDVINDGMYLELEDVTDGRSDILLFAFWSDVDGQFTFSAYKPDLPFALVETFVAEARLRLPPRDTSQPAPA